MPQELSGGQRPFQALEARSESTRRSAARCQCGRRRARAAPRSRERARESGGHGVAAGPRARPTSVCAFGASARAALSGRSRRARLDSKRDFTVDAVFGACEAWALDNPLRRPSATLEAAATRRHRTLRRAGAGGVTRPALERSATPAEIVELKKYRRSMPDGVVPPRARLRNRSWDTRRSDSKLPSRN